MKKFLLIFGAVLSLSALQAQTQQQGQGGSPTNQKTESTTIPASDSGKEHVCSAACKAGKHSYAHGERGHKCGAECMKAMSKDTGKEHVCSAACKDGQHSYAHGERGHKCGAACKKPATGPKKG